MWQGGSLLGRGGPRMGLGLGRGGGRCYSVHVFGVGGERERERLGAGFGAEGADRVSPSSGGGRQRSFSDGRLSCRVFKI